MDFSGSLNRTIWKHVAGTMTYINIRLWRNSEAQDWHVEMNGVRHMHVTTEIMEDLVEAAMIVAENSLTEAAIRPLQ